MASSAFAFGTIASASSSLPKTRPQGCALFGQKLAQSKFSSPLLRQNLNLQVTNAWSNLPNAIKSFTCRIQHQASDSEPSNEVQELHIYEFNERDRGSPVYLRFSNKNVNTLGDIAPFTNKIYSGDLKKRLGITSGILLLMNIPGKQKQGDRYEVMMSFYFGDYGHIACQGPYISNEDTHLAVTGGTGIFEGVRGQVKLHNVLYPLKLYYVFRLKGIAKLPAELTGTPVESNLGVEPAPAAKALEPRGVISNFTDQ